MDWHTVEITTQTVIFLLGVYGMVLRTDLTGKGLKEEIRDMKDELKQLAEVIKTQAVQTERINNMEKHVVMLQETVEALRRGNGFIRGRKDVDGEYP